MGKQHFTLFRRHVKSCTNTTPTTDTDLRSITLRINAKDCHCPIVATGYLRFEEKRQQKIPMEANDWRAAQDTANNLLKAGRIPAPEPIQPKTRPAGEITVKYAVAEYMKSRTQGSDVIGSSTQHQYKVLLHGRLLPWCDKNKIVALKEFEDPHTVRQFDQSWKNLKEPDRPLGTYTRKTIIQSFRTFGRYCLENKWTTVNFGKIIKPPKRAGNQAQSKRYGLELHEYEIVLKALDNAYPMYGHVHRLRVFVELMRWTGMRLSDATKFCRSELVRNMNDDGWDANFIQKKTGMPCVSPVPDHVAELLLALPFRSTNTSSGEMYWFWNGVRLEHAIQAWGIRIRNLFIQAEKIEPFKHHASAHSLRHTFAIHCLNEAADPVTVSSWLGHQSVAITLDHYGHAIASTVMGRLQTSKEVQRKLRAKIEALNAPGKVVAIRRQA